MKTITVKEQDGIQCVSARELYKGLEITHRYNEWFNSVCKYGFKENVDFTSVQISTVVNNGAKKPITDHYISLDMAKQICMLQRSEKGRQYREYFLQLEKAWNSPEAIIARGLQLANKKIEELKPLAELAKTLTSSKDAISMSKAVKVLEVGVGRNTAFAILRGKKILQADNTPYQAFIDRGYFRVRETPYKSPDGEIHIRTVTEVYQKGMIFLKRILEEDKAIA